MKSFNAALSQALNRDPDLSAEKLTWDAVRAEGVPTRLFMLPDLTGRGSLSRDSDNVRAQRLSLGIDWNLFRFGADEKLNEAQEAKEIVASARARAKLLSQESSISEAFLFQTLSGREKKMLDQLIEMQKENFKLAKSRYDLGRIPLQELNILEIDLENVFARISETDRKEIKAKAEVERYLGENTLDPTEWPWKKAITETRVNPPPESEIYSSRPDWIEATAESKRDAAIASRNDRLMLPSISANFDYGYTRYTSSDSPFIRSWTGTLGISIPLFQRLTLRSQARGSELESAATLQRMESVRRKVREEIVRVPREFEIARDTALRRERLLKISRQLYADNLRRFKAGRSSTTELTVDLDRYLQTELNAIQGWYDAHIAYLSYLHLVGKSVLE